MALAAPSLAILLPNPLPTSTPPAISASKLPFSPLRKSLRLLIDDNPEALEELENDISFVYSGYAPLSVRLVQCVAQKGGVLSNPAEKEKSLESSNKAPDGGKVQAHPIVGWKGFEDILAMIPGKTVDVVQNGVGVTPSGGIGRHTSCHTRFFFSLLYLARPKDKATTTVVFFLGGCTYTEIAALRWVARQNRGLFTF